MKTRRQEFVTYVSPGTFSAETTTKPIESRDIRMALRMGQNVEERHGAKPYCFFFTTKIVADDVDDGEGGKLTVAPKQVDRSSNYFMGGLVLSYDDLEARNNKKESILRGNMLRNNIPFVVESHNSYKASVPFEEGDVVVDAQGEIAERGNSPERISYRRAFEVQK